jgi:predicted enzyme related to lactoylglutathione lyase
MSSLEKRKSIPDAAVPLATFIGVLSLILALSSPSLIKGQIETTEPVTLIKSHALKLNVDDMDKALKFYVEKLGFEVEERSGYPHRVILKTNDRIKLILNRVKHLQKTGPSDSQVGITLQVNDLDQTIARLKSGGVKFAENQARKEAVGNAISILDPFGRRISLMHQTIVKVEPFKEPRIYNFGLLIPDMAAGRHFYVDDLGFVVRSEKYLPLDLPLGHRDKSFAFMLHYRPGVQAVKTDYPAAMPYNMVVFATDDLKAALEGLKQKGIKVIAMEPATAGKSGSAVFSDSFGNLSEIEEAGK